MEKTNFIDAVVFDIGGVLVPLTPAEKMLGWLSIRSEQELSRRWMKSMAMQAFEQGQLQPFEFASIMIQEFNLSVTSSVFIEEFAGWQNPPFAGVYALLTQLKNRVLLASLSNTNLLQWGKLEANSHLIEFFDFSFPSHRTGHLKPNKAAFSVAFDGMAVAPERILFLDDNAENIATAATLGCHARQTIGFASVQRQLAEFELINI